MAANKWQQTEEMAKKHDQGSSTWLKLGNDGDKAVVVFLGEPFPREVCFVDGKYMPFDDKLKAQGLKPSLRVALNVVLYDTKEVKVLEQGVTFFKDLVRVREKYGIERWAFEIQRHGAAKDPKTTYSILPEHQLTPEQQKEFQGLKLNDLDKLYGDSEDSSSLGSYDRKDDGVIDAGTAQTIATQLKTMPREAADRFCKKFGVTRIKDLPAAQVEKARAFVEVLASEFAAPAAADSHETDPFA
ncbi:MAG: hypothetical protein HRF43_00560 [Phycisphaerae bacterium]|jgi:hypothetical protein